MCKKEYVDYDTMKELLMNIDAKLHDLQVELRRLKCQVSEHCSEAEGHKTKGWQ